jgi:hypothetical protein
MPRSGRKVATESAWFAARPSGTEDVYKIYAESFKGREHLAEVQEAARPSPLRSTADPRLNLAAAKGGKACGRWEPDLMADLADLQRWCTALRDDPEMLAAEVMVAAGRRWSSLADSPAEVRRLTFQTFLRRSGRQRGRDGSVPALDVDQASAGLWRLTPLQRALVVLRCLDQLTQAEIGGVRPPSRGRPAGARGAFRVLGVDARSASS